ncbi:hypothetical protein [Acinetobacter brisouii]|uniref:hypothetical protein n=1 Tax=Acinetobacter brisouii TaxID=396323 RepID=UPI00124F40A1|nr:hypothetical protein [Acinetobacter brisouii]
MVNRNYLFIEQHEGKWTVKSGDRFMALDKDTREPLFFNEREDVERFVQSFGLFEAPECEQSEFNPHAVPKGALVQFSGWSRNGV